MDTPTLLLLGLAVGVALLVVLAVSWRLRIQGRRSRERDAQLGAMVQELRAENADLRRTVVELQRRTAPPAPSQLITDAGTAGPAEQLPDRVVVSATLGEPLIRAAAAWHGLRRALSPQERNRIRFEMRREVKQARKDRRRHARTRLREQRAYDARPEEVA